VTVCQVGYLYCELHDFILYNSCCVVIVNQRPFAFTFASDSLLSAQGKICQSYSQKFTATFLWATVYNRFSAGLTHKHTTRTRRAPSGKGAPSKSGLRNNKVIIYLKGKFKLRSAKMCASALLKWSIINKSGERWTTYMIGSIRTRICVKQYFLFVD